MLITLPVWILLTAASTIMTAILLRQMASQRDHMTLRQQYLDLYARSEEYNKRLNNCILILMNELGDVVDAATTPIELRLSIQESLRAVSGECCGNARL